MTELMAAAPSRTWTENLRSLVASDLDRVVEIDSAASGQSRRGFFENRLQASLREPSAFISLGLVEDEALQGFVMAQLFDGEFGGRDKVAALDAIAIAENARGHGGGHALLGELRRKARARGARELRTQALWSDQPLIHFLATAGFALGHRLVLQRACARRTEEIAAEETVPDDSPDLSYDRIAVRSMATKDLPLVVAIDRHITHADRAGYYQRKIGEALNESGIRLSMLAEIDRTPAGFIMARLDYGEFGETAAEAVLDTLAVDPEFAGQHVGGAMLRQLLANLQGLRVERIRTELRWDELELMAFLKRLGFEPSQRLCMAMAL